MIIVDSNHKRIDELKHELRGYGVVVNEAHLVNLIQYKHEHERLSYSDARMLIHRIREERLY